MILFRVGGWVGSYSDIKTNLSQVGLDWDWPTGLSLAKKHGLKTQIFIFFVSFRRAYETGVLLRSQELDGWLD